jgi:hypothetical protein
MIRTKHALRVRFTVEAALAAITGVLALVTLISAEWIEALTGWEPDAGSGALEWAVVAVFAVCAAGLALLARLTFKQLTAP